MTQRPGVTLIEVLVSIFVMGIGLLAILTLFPLGALNMAQAIKDDRAGHCAATATSLAIAQDIRNDANVTAAYDNPGAGFTFPTPYNGPTFAVYVDPFGYTAALTNQGYVGDAPAVKNVPRTTLSFIAANLGTTPAVLPRWCLSPDDIDFADGGAPNAPFDRNGLYSWAWLVRRPKRSDPTVVNLAVVVYSNRPLRLTQGLNPRENTYSATFDTVNNRVRVTWTAGQPTPEIRAGGWFLDATVEAAGGVVSMPHGTFYRARDVVQPNIANTIDLIPDTPLQDFLNNGTVGNVILLDGVVEVFAKGSPWKS
jgi:prepilin-type N-terminal cleavage/methylation domain-containing protein